MAGRKGVGLLNAFELSGLLFVTFWAFLWAQLGFIVGPRIEPDRSTLGPME